MEYVSVCMYIFAEWYEVMLLLSRIFILSLVLYRIASRRISNMYSNNYDRAGKVVR